MKTGTIAVLGLFLCALLAAAPRYARAADTNDQIQALLDGAGIKPEGNRRGQMDTIGYASTKSQMAAVLAQCMRLAAPRRQTLDREHGWDTSTTFAAGVCPHDDYYYSGRLYSLLLSRIRANQVIIFGVFHKARLFDCRDRLVFDNYDAWHGPFGPITVSPVREEIIERLPETDYLVDNDMQMVEHSVEGIAGFLQAYNPDVEIVSILVPYMGWSRLDSLAADCADALESIAREHGWKLGTDLALICSADAVHYGDAGWGGSNYAEFGTNVAGYRKAVERDRSLAENYLCGAVDPGKLKSFLYSCVDGDDVMQYRITWCGRFSIPFGLNVASRLSERLEGHSLAGVLLDYGTSVSEISLDLGLIPGLGVTAPNNLHHFVGYAAIGYR